MYDIFFIFNLIGRLFIGDITVVGDVMYDILLFLIWLAASVILDISWWRHVRYFFIFNLIGRLFIGDISWWRHVRYFVIFNLIDVIWHLPLFDDVIQ